MNHHANGGDIHPAVIDRAKLLVEVDALRAELERVKSWQAAMQAKYERVKGHWRQAERDRDALADVLRSEGLGAAVDRILPAQQEPER
jgi:hypothetical protein